jgi:hypothetical protein
MRTLEDVTISVREAQSKNYTFVWLETDHEYISEEDITEDIVYWITEEVARRYALFYSKIGRDIKYEEFFMLVASITIHEMPLLFTQSWNRKCVEVVKEQYSNIIK